MESNLGSGNHPGSLLTSFVVTGGVLLYLHLHLHASLVGELISRCVYHAAAFHIFHQDLIWSASAICVVRCPGARMVTALAAGLVSRSRLSGRWVRWASSAPLHLASIKPPSSTRGIVGVAKSAGAAICEYSVSLQSAELLSPDAAVRSRNISPR